MTDVYEEEKNSVATGKSGGSNLIISLIRASVESADSGTTNDSQAESEIYGNVFVFNFAGHDIIAHTLAFAVVILSAHPAT